MSALVATSILDSIASVWSSFVMFTIFIIVVTSIWLNVLAFKKSITWGVAAFVIPGVIFLFGVLHWDRVRKTMLAYMGAWAALTIEFCITYMFNIQLR